MFKNYLITAINYFSKNRLYSAINILGLSVGLAACIQILLYVQNESSYDKNWNDADRLFRVHTTFTFPGRAPYRLSTASSLLIPVMSTYFNEEIETSSRAWSMDLVYKVDDRVFNESVVGVDPNFIELFPLTELSGSLKDTFANNSSIALSETMALRLFGSVDVLGQVLTLAYSAGELDYKVNAVYQTPNANTIIELPALIKFDESRDDIALNTWNQVPVASYVKLKPEILSSVIRNKLNDLSDQYVDISAMGAGPDASPSDVLTFDMKNISELYLDSNFEDIDTNGNKTSVQAFSVIAVLIVLIASINFTVLSTARSTQRVKDVLIRKTIGATRRQLVVQYLGESFFIVFISSLIGVMLVELTLPAFEGFLGAQLGFDYGSPKIYLHFLILVTVVAFAGGVYPAFILSSFKPASILRTNKIQDAKGLLNMRALLIIFQFGIAIALIIATCIIYLQVEFVSKRDPGFNKENIIILDELYSRPEVSGKMDLLRQEIAALAQVQNASFSGYHPMSTTAFSRLSSAFTLPGISGESFILANTFIDEHYFEAYRMGFISGRNFSLKLDQKGEPPASSIFQSGVILNEAAVRHFNFASPDEALGEAIISPRQNPDDNRHFIVIGVIADTQFYSLRAEPRPEIYFFSTSFNDVLAVRYRGNPQTVMADLEATWYAVIADAEFSASYLEQHVALEFSQEIKEGQMFVAFSLFSIFIACLGLYGSAVFTVERRSKEIAIRKVMGAEIKEIINLLLWQFSRPILVANVIAWPLALWAMLTWLQRFPYQIDNILLIPLCVMAGTLALLIGWITVASNTFKVARAKPVYALKYE